MSKTKEYTTADVLSIIDYAKDQNIKSDEVLLNWIKDKNNRIDEDDEHGLSVVGIFEHPIKNKSNKEIGKIVVFNYTGVGGGWHNDIYKMVEKKYFSDTPYYNFISGDNNSFYYRFFLTGDVFSDEAFSEWDKPKGIDEFRVVKHELPNSELVIALDMSEKRVGSSMRSDLERSNSEYCMYYDDSACRYYIKNIDELKYEKSKPIIEQRIRDRKLKGIGI